MRIILFILSFLAFMDGIFHSAIFGGGTVLIQPLSFLVGAIFLVGAGVVDSIVVFHKDALSRMDEALKNQDPKPQQDSGKA